MFQGIQITSYRTDKATAASGGFLCLLSSLQIKTQVTSILNSIHLCCICVITPISLFLVLINLQLYPWTLFARLLFHYLFGNKYALFLFMIQFSFILGISYTPMENWQACYSIDDINSQYIGFCHITQSSSCESYVTINQQT